MSETKTELKDPSCVISKIRNLLTNAVGSNGEFITPTNTQRSNDLNCFLDNLINTPYFLWDPSITLHARLKYETSRESALHKDNINGSNRLVSSLSALLNEIDNKDNNIIISIAKGIINLDKLLSYDPLTGSSSLSSRLRFIDIVHQCQQIRKLIPRDSSHQFDTIDCVVIAAASLCYYDIGDYSTVILLWDNMPELIPRPMYLETSRSSLLESGLIIQNLDIYPLTIITTTAIIKGDNNNNNNKREIEILTQPKTTVDAITQLRKIIEHSK